MLKSDLPYQIKHAISVECKASQNGYAQDLGWAPSNMSRIVNRQLPNEKTLELLDMMGYDLYIEIAPNIQTRANRLANEINFLPKNLSAEEREKRMNELALKYFPESADEEE